MEANYFKKMANNNKKHNMVKQKALTMSSSISHLAILFVVATSLQRLNLASAIQLGSSAD